MKTFASVRSYYWYFSLVSVAVCSMAMQGAGWVAYLVDGPRSPPSQGELGHVFWWALYSFGLFPLMQIGFSVIEVWFGRRGDQSYLKRAAVLIGMGLVLAALEILLILGAHIALLDEHFI